MSENKTYGSWISPITSDLIVSETVRLGQVILGNESTYWTEGRPQEGGRPKGPLHLIDSENLRSCKATLDRSAFQLILPTH